MNQRSQRTIERTATVSGVGFLTAADVSLRFLPAAPGHGIAFQRTDRENFKEDMDRVFEFFPRLYERRAQKAGTMSGGEQQMCAMGRALMARPKLLLLDEPSMGLAPIFVEKIFEIVVEINQQGTPVLLVEQNALMALDVASRGYVLETGRIALADDAKALRGNEQVRKTYLGET